MKKQGAKPELRKFPQKIKLEKNAIFSREETVCMGLSMSFYTEKIGFPVLQSCARAVRAFFVCFVRCFRRHEHEKTGILDTKQGEMKQEPCTRKAEHLAIKKVS